MSTAQNEAENGPAMFRGDDEHGEEAREGDGGESAGDFPTRVPESPERSNEDKDGVTVVATGAPSRRYQNTDQEHHEADSNLESSTTPERPSSADGSLSIPDDTPSIQVGFHPASRRLVTDLIVARSPNYPLKAGPHLVHPTVKVLLPLYAPSTDVFKLVFLLRLSAHLGLLRQPPVIHVPAKLLYRAKYSAIREMRNNLKRHGR